MEDRYVIKYYYNDKFIGYHNSYGESRGFVWTRIYAGSDEKYIKKYNSERGANIASNSGYYDNSHDLIINEDVGKAITVTFDNCFIKEIRDKGFGIYADKVRKEICKLSEIGNDKIDLSELKEIEERYMDHLNEKIENNKKTEDIMFKPTNIWSKEVNPGIQDQFNEILKILDKENEEIIGGLVYDNEVLLSQIEAIKEGAPDFYNDNRVHGDSPTCKQILEFMQNNPQFVAETHVVAPERDDYRFDIVGVKAPTSKENKLILYNWINSLDIDNQPDEYGEYKGYIRAWWD